MREMLIVPLLLFGCAALTAAQFNCTQANTAFCESPVSGVTVNNIIFRCPYNTGSAVPGNCNDDLAQVPPIGLKYAYCWESSPTAGDAQCTYNCVAVTAANGTTFYPVGCNRTDTTTTSDRLLSSTQTASSSLSFFVASASATASISDASSTTPKATALSTSNPAVMTDSMSMWQLLVVGAGALVL